MTVFRCFILLALSAGLFVAMAQDSAEAMLNRAIELYRNGEVDQAFDLANAAIKKEPRDPTGYFVRGTVFESRQQYESALADYEHVAKMSPDLALVYSRRGGLYFKMGRIEDSITDFDKEVTLDPAKQKNHWQRGLSYYYAKRYQEGADQFELAFKTVNPKDYENGIWHFLCRVRIDGIEKARSAVLNVAGDERVPMKEVYDLYRGIGTAEDVMRATEQGYPNAAELKDRLFYALFYVAAYEDVAGDGESALRRLNRAVSNFEVAHYMWDVARIHRDLLRVERKGSESEQ
ncbi:MAG: tetratricopeptide repeat protein [Acidobacteria bacterium]|nr:tetratricopeptide repeat protein [Acidobacteriota bacterium]